MTKVNVHQAKTQLSKLLEKVEAGEDVVIARAGVPVARLVAVGPQGGKRRFGQDRGRFEVPEEFDEPLPRSLLALFHK